MISLCQLNATSDAEFVARLGNIYEHSDWVPRRIMDQRPFPDSETLRRAMSAAVNDSTAEEMLILIQAHPDLAGKLARAGKLTEASTAEQAGLGLDRLSEAEYEQFSQRNEAYREKFGFPFIICARLTTRQGVLEAFSRRLENSRDAEISEAVRQIHEIANLRLGDLIGE